MSLVFPFCQQLKPAKAYISLYTSFFLLFFNSSLRLSIHLPKKEGVLVKFCLCFLSNIRDANEKVCLIINVWVCLIFFGQDQLVDQMFEQ